MYPGVGLLDHMVTLILVFWGISICTLSIVAAPIYIPTNSEEGSLLSTPFPAFVICWLFNGGHFDWCEVIRHCSFDLLFQEFCFE